MINNLIYSLMFYSFDLNFGFLFIIKILIGFIFIIYIIFLFYKSFNSYYSNNNLKKLFISKSEYSSLLLFLYYN